MKLMNTFLFLTALALFTSCGNGSGESGSSETSTTPSTATPVNNNPANPAAMQVPPAVNMSTPPVTTNNLPAAPVLNTGSVGLNPEHGKPGHRCDIAVGAPLNSKPAAVTTNPQVISSGNAAVPVPSVNPQGVTSQKNPIVINNPAAPATVAPGMNPAHGQPGHRCDIAVGAPLNSKPAPAQTTPAAVNANPQSIIKQTPTTLTTPPVVTAPGMNPEHGKPGHRCDIAVGAPLNSKPAQ
jgi:hypothetical protein